MGNITNDTFNPIRAFCNVRLQQGVPLVDADVNELDDIRKFEMRAYLKWFVGNGVPEGNDGFRIAATGATTNFMIQVGSQSSGSVPTPPSPATNEFALKNFGRCIVDGLDVVIQDNTTYSEQTISAIDFAPPYSVPPLSGIPNIAGPVLVFLDIWERVVYPAEDSSIVVQPLGTETCARIKRQWVVRARPGTSVPVQGDLDFRPNHLYYGLARIDRRMDPTTGDPAPILQTDITDLRERGLMLTPSTLIQDTLGETAVQYRTGQNRPGISLRDAINAIAWGEVPATPEQLLTASVPDDMTLDSQGGLIVTKGGSGGVDVTRLDLGDPSAGVTTTQIVSSPNAYGSSTVLTLPGGDLLVAYIEGSNSVYFQRGSTPSALAAASKQAIATVGNGTRVFAVASGNIVVFFWYDQVVDRYRYRRYDASGGGYLDPQPVDVKQQQTNVPANGNLHAAVDSAGYVWVAFINKDLQPTGETIDDGFGNTTPVMAIVETLRVFRLNPSSSSGAQDAAVTLTPPSGIQPYVFAADGQARVFWRDYNGISFTAYNGSSWAATTQWPDTRDGDLDPTATLDASGRIALAYTRFSQGYIALSRANPNNGVRLPPAIAVSSGGHARLFESDGSLWLTWTRAGRLYYRRICSPL